MHCFKVIVHITDYSKPLGSYTVCSTTVISTVLVWLFVYISVCCNLLLLSLLQLSSTITTDTTATPQLSSLKAIAEQAIVQANLFPPSRKLPEDGDALRSEYAM